MPMLVTIEVAAEELGVPVKSLRTTTEEHGFVVRIVTANPIRGPPLPRSRP